VGESVHPRIQRRYFAALLIPTLLLLVLAAGPTMYIHAKGMETMKRDVEKSRIRVTESISNNIDTLLGQIRLSAANLSIQMEKAIAGKGEPFSLYRSAADQMMYLQLNTQSLLNPIVNRGYLFLFDENRVISQSSTLYPADALYEHYFRINNEDYDRFRARFSQCYFDGRVLPEIAVGYMDEVYHTWVVVQTIPSDPTASHTGVIIFTLDMDDLRQRLSGGLTDEDSLCLLRGEGGESLAVQGSGQVWTEAEMDRLLDALSGQDDGVFYLPGPDGAEYLVTAAQCRENRIITAQRTRNAFRGVYDYHQSMVRLTVAVLLLAAGIAFFFVYRNTMRMQGVLDAIAPQNQSGSAKNVFQYMREAIVFSQQKELLLTAHADRQRDWLRGIFLKRLLRGEFVMESDLLREQNIAGVTLEAAYYTVLLVRFWYEDQTEPSAMALVREAFHAEFGAEHVVVADMEEGTVACLLMTEEADLRESIEAVADTLAAKRRATGFVSNTVGDRMDIPRAYREARMMARMSQEGAGVLLWYCDLFQDDVLYNFEYSLFTETKLCNNIAAGNRQGTTAIFDALYENSLKQSVGSTRVLRFFAYDLYRLVNHIGANSGQDAERTAFLKKLQGMIDAVIDNPKNFDAFFSQIRAYCLEICRQNDERHQGGGNELLENVRRYIDEQFSDPLLSVSGIAQHFGLSDKYVSQLFKEQTNEKISCYIENKRITHACHLLDTTEMTINDVASASGYALTHTFRVAFKKILGVTPLQWKKAHDSAEAND
jgi:two-component system response regulator YesN